MTPLYSGAHYFLTTVDDYSMGVWVFLMKFNSEAQYDLTTFVNMVHIQFNRKVKRIRASPTLGINPRWT